MVYKEEVRDLFSVSGYHLTHCISDDYALGAGIAVQFNRRFDMRRKLFSIRPQSPCFADTNGHCILIDGVFNLVTKNKCLQKPTYATLTNALVDMKRQCIENDVKQIAMPLIGCGLDRLEWNDVSTIIRDVFDDTDIEVLICKQ